MKANRLRTLQVVLFLPALCVVLVALYGVLVLAIRAGNALVYAWAAFLSGVLGLPQVLAGLLALVLVPATVLLVYRRLFPDPKGSPRTQLKA